MVKRLSILDEDFIGTESASVLAIQEARNLMNTATKSVMDIACNENEEIRFCPAYIQIKSEINPVESVTRINEDVVKAITAKQRHYKLNEAAVLSEIYNKLYSVDTASMGATEEATSIFGVMENFSFDPASCEMDLNESGLVELRRKLSSIREDNSALLSELNSAANSNNIGRTTEILQKLVLLKEFVKFL